MSLLYPFLEAMDPWDSPEPSTDAEIQLIALFTFVCIMFVLGHLVAALAISIVMQVLPYLQSRARIVIKVPDFAFLPLLTASPPLPLRI